MLRPKLRPTLSRRTKYWGIAPTAQNKLGKEARRGSFDLRKLVGHANFLDVLIEQLDPPDEDENVQSSAVASNESHPSEEVEDPVEDDDSDGSDWSDASDDEDHALFRTNSGTSPATNDSESPPSTIPSPEQNGGDYFQHAKHSEAATKFQQLRDDVSATLQENEKDVNVIVTSELVELMDELGWRDDEIASPSFSEKNPDATPMTVVV